MAIDYAALLSIVLTTAITISTSISLFLLTAPEPYPFPDIPAESSTVSSGDEAKSQARPRDRVTVVVVGDIGRSPRMQYHALSLARHGVEVQLVGYHESSVHPEVESNKLISIIALPPYPKILQTSRRILFPILAPLKVLFQVATLYYTLGYKTPPSRAMLIQNPPSIPTIPVALVIAILRRTRLVIDWHNYGFTILATKLGLSHPLISVARYIEVEFGKIARTHFTVTDAMAKDLATRSDGRASAIALHDRPASIYRPLTTDERASALSKLSLTSDFASELEMGQRRLVVSSTSWTPDEDYSILVDALVLYYSAYTERASTESALPKLLVVITGKGPLKAEFDDVVNGHIQDGRLPPSAVSSPLVIRTAWLPAQDYALILAAASVGVSFHKSSSGLDLPMKVVDMFGAGLPVLGYSKDFPAWSELVQEGINGQGFDDAEELADRLERVFTTTGMLSRLRAGALQEGERRWDDEWDQVAWPVMKPRSGINYASDTTGTKIS